MSMELCVAQAIHAAKTLERVALDRGPWEIGYGDLVVPAVRFVTDEQVIFRAHFPDACMLQHPERPEMRLLCRGEVVSVRAVEEPADGDFVTEWIFRTRENVPVA